MSTGDVPDVRIPTSVAMTVAQQNTPGSHNDSCNDVVAAQVHHRSVSCHSPAVLRSRARGPGSGQIWHPYEQIERIIGEDLQQTSQFCRCLDRFIET